MRSTVSGALWLSRGDPTKSFLLRRQLVRFEQLADATVAINNAFTHVRLAVLLGERPMTRQVEKDEERFYASEYLKRRGIVGKLDDRERPDFLVRTNSGTLGVEVISYGTSGGRQVASA
jgi:hypothetical protein